MSELRLLALLIVVVCTSSGQAGFLTKGDVSVGGNSVKYAVEQKGLEFHYYYQIDKRIETGTSQMFISSSGFKSASLTDDVTIDLDDEMLVSANGSTFNRSTLLFDSAIGVGLADIPQGNKPTRLLTAISMFSHTAGSASITINGHVYNFSAPVPTSPVAVPLPPALALIATGIPFAGLVSRLARRRASR